MSDRLPGLSVHSRLASRPLLKLLIETLIGTSVLALLVMASILFRTQNPAWSDLFEPLDLGIIRPPMWIVLLIVANGIGHVILKPFAKPIVRPGT